MAVGVVDELEVVDVNHQEGHALVVPAGALHLFEEALRERTAVRKLCQLVSERVLLLRLKQLRVADGDGRLRRDTLQQIDLIVGQVARGR